MQVITDAKELEKHTYIKTRNPAVFPKKERLGLAQRMMNEASDLVADLMEANDLLLTDPEERELRYRAQRSALRNCRKLIHHIELAHEILSGFGDDAFAYWAKMAAGVKNQTAKWYQKPIKRGPPSWTHRSVTSEAALGVCLAFFRAGSANNARHVGTDGALGGDVAYSGGDGLRPASMDRPTY